MTTDFPSANTDEGALVRLLLVEIGNQPNHPDEVEEAMGLMKRVLENRLENPQDFYAAGATTMTQIIQAHRADGKGIQFQGFQSYPTLASPQQGELTDDLGKPDLVAAAITVAKATTAPPDPSANGLYFWRTHGHPLNRRGYAIFRTVAGIDFYQKISIKKRYEKGHHVNGPAIYAHGRPSSPPASGGMSSSGPMTYAHGRPASSLASGGVGSSGPMIYPNKRPGPR